MKRMTVRPVDALSSAARARAGSALAVASAAVAVLAATIAPAAGAQDALARLDFDAAGLAELPAGAVIHTQFDRPDRVPGMAGGAWRTDGFSSWLSLPLDLSGAAGFTAAAWVALESYPSDLEVPVRRLSPSSILHQRNGNDGFDLFIDTYGRWGFWVSTSRGRLTLDAPERFPVYEWTHVAATATTGADGGPARLALYLNGEEVAAETLRSGTELNFADTDLELARSHTEVEFLYFTINRLNGAYDDVAVYGRALDAAEVRALYAASGNAPADAMASLIVPESRLAGDHRRPRLHAMPPANWTNEPHGMVRFGGDWHLFYQRTPNGPYKFQMHWGHMASSDLVAWRHLKDALWPELQDDEFGFDQKGIWSGDVIVDGGRAFAFYTSVNHSDRLAASNPGVAMAISEDPNLETWQKFGPIINSAQVNDFRDPYLWREGGTWHMIIGATLDSGGGLDYHVLDTETGRWTPRERFVSVSYRILDNGSAIWEMPVFEPLTEEVHVLVVNPIGGRVSKYGEPATRGVYWTGRWEDGLFHPDYTEPKMLDLIPGHLAPTVERADDGLLRAIGIVDERRTPQSQEDAGWAHTFSFPRAWRLMPDGQTLGQAPAPELRALRGEPLPVPGSESGIAAGAGPGVEPDAVGGAAPGAAAGATDPGPVPVRLTPGAHALELELNLDETQPASMLHVDVLASPDRREFTRLTFDPDAGEVVLDKSNSTLSAENEGPDVLRGGYDAGAFGPMRSIRVFVDGSIVEVLINDAAAFSFRSYPQRADSTGVWVSAPDGGVSLAGAAVWPLRLPE